uniref:BZIP domain-containing protein n=1 Tax=Strongyloides venezuelensis TaxID=75913 RepID=A0A0K0FTT3_STRVS
MNILYIDIKTLILIFVFVIFTSSSIINSLEKNSEALFCRSLIANSDIFLTIKSIEDDNKLVAKRQPRRIPAARRRRGQRQQIQRLRNQIASLTNQINALQSMFENIVRL